ncbi:MAG: type II secretion system protein [Desulfobacteraceae bacterium]|nr:type II secretion system protein [Desulfobacteraceae bacterium]
MITNFKNQSGFTLIEMLIVIVVLGILAMIIIPQITVSTEDAKVSTLQTNLSGMRSAVETYYAQHDSTYPGRKKTAILDVGVDTIAGDAVAAFTTQLTQYTTAAGTVATSKDATFKYGPYIKGSALPKNPFTATNDVTLDITTTNITTRVADTGTKAWKFYAETGVLIANDTAAHALY